jgi:hypothetical protein
MNLTPAEARTIAKEAYIYGFPMVDNLRVQYAYFTDKRDPDYKAPYNVVLRLKLTRVLHRTLTRLGEPQYGSGWFGFLRPSFPPRLD